VRIVHERNGNLVLAGSISAAVPQVEGDWRGGCGGGDGLGRPGGRHAAVMAQLRRIGQARAKLRCVLHQPSTLASCPPAGQVMGPKLLPVGIVSWGVSYPHIQSSNAAMVATRPYFRPPCTAWGSLPLCIFRHNQATVLASCPPCVWQTDKGFPGCSPRWRTVPCRQSLQSAQGCWEPTRVAEFNHSGLGVWWLELRCLPGAAADKQHGPACGGRLERSEQQGACLQEHGWSAATGPWMVRITVEGACICARLQEESVICENELQVCLLANARLLNATVARRT
jgi:hypothetical protein